MLGWVEKSYDRCIRGTYLLLYYYIFHELLYGFMQNCIVRFFFNIYIFTLINKDPFPTFALMLMNYVVFDPWSIIFR